MSVPVILYRLKLDKGWQRNGREMLMPDHFRLKKKITVSFFLNN